MCKKEKGHTKSETPTRLLLFNKLTNRSQWPATSPDETPIKSIPFEYSSIACSYSYRSTSIDDRISKRNKLLLAELPLKHWNRDNNGHRSSYYWQTFHDRWIIKIVAYLALKTSIPTRFVFYCLSHSALSLLLLLHALVNAVHHDENIQCNLHIYRHSDKNWPSRSFILEEVSVDQDHPTISHQTNPLTELSRMTTHQHASRGSECFQKRRLCTDPLRHSTKRRRRLSSSSSRYCSFNFFNPA